MIKVQFFYNQWYLMALDIIETKLFKESKELLKNLFPNSDVIYLLKVRLLTLLIFLKF